MSYLLPYYKISIIYKLCSININNYINFLYEKCVGGAHDTIIYP